MNGALDRFKVAQGDPRNGFATALRELREGWKRSHWIWYVFPQLAGLGTSPMAVAYGLRDVDEAIAYLRDPLLRERLVGVTRAVAEKAPRTPGFPEHRGGQASSDSAVSVSLRDLMGSDIDARKLVSSMTLFGALARRLDAVEPHEDYATLGADADAILRAAAAQGIPECVFTRRHINKS